MPDRNIFRAGRSPGLRLHTLLGRLR